MFYRIILRMYFAPNEHSPPHFHAYCGEHKGVVDIRTCEVVLGDRLTLQVRPSRHGQSFIKMSSWLTGIW